MRSRTSGSAADTARRMNDGSSLDFPTRNSWMSKSPPSSTIRANARRRMSESMRWPCMVTVSWTIGWLQSLGRVSAFCPWYLPFLSA